MQDEAREKLVVVSLDVKNKILAFEVVCVGTINVVHAKYAEIVRTPILVKASSMILIHNHPSGDSTPSEEDFKLTNEVIDLCGKLGIPLEDHIVVGTDNYFSFAENGLIEFES